jgi:3-dehydro-4-phosphotetronate decarboxylase
MNNENELRQDIVRWGRSLFERGFITGSAGNISVKLDDGYLMTPTNSCLGFLDPERISRLDTAGTPIGGDKPTKEIHLHLAFYEARPAARAVVHLHSTFATALSCLADIDWEDAVAPITPYVVMRVGRVPVLPYVKPGAPEIGSMVRERAPDHAAILLANHGPVVAGQSLEAAVYAAEELEETARLILLTRSMKVRRLTPEQIAELNAAFKLR